MAQGAKADQPFVASLQAGREALVFSCHTLRMRFRTACGVLGVERLKSLTIHHGRSTFISHALAGGRTLAEVRDAAEHPDMVLTYRLDESRRKAAARSTRRRYARANRQPC